MAADAREMARRFLVFVVVGLHVATDEEPDLRRAYAAASGHLVLGVRTSYADVEARARVDAAPPRLGTAYRASYEEFSEIEDAGTGEPHDGRRRRRATVG